MGPLKASWERAWGHGMLQLGGHGGGAGPMPDPSRGKSQSSVHGNLRRVLEQTLCPWQSRGSLLLLPSAGTLSHPPPEALRVSAHPTLPPPPGVSRLCRPPSFRPYVCSARGWFSLAPVMASHEWSSGSPFNDTGCQAGSKKNCVTTAVSQQHGFCTQEVESSGT